MHILILSSKLWHFTTNVETDLAPHFFSKIRELNAIILGT